MRAAIADAEVVVHLAALVDPALQSDAAAVFRVNRDLTLSLAAIAESAGVRRFVFVSSIAAMGFWSGIATPASECHPETPYGRAKRDAELELLRRARPGFDVFVLRPPTVYGPGEAYNFLAWVRAVDRGVFRVIGSGENRFPLATTENVARGLVAAAEGALAPGVHLVADREAYSVARIDAAIRGALGKPLTRLRIPVCVAALAGFVNEQLHRSLPGLPIVLTRARVRTLTVDQHFDLGALLRSGVELDAPLEDWVRRTVASYRQRGLIRG